MPAFSADILPQLSPLSNSVHNSQSCEYDYDDSHEADHPEDEDQAPASGTPHSVRMPLQQRTLYISTGSGDTEVVNLAPEPSNENPVRASWAFSFWNDQGGYSPSRDRPFNYSRGTDRTEALISPRPPTRQGPRRLRYHLPTPAQDTDSVRQLRDGNTTPRRLQLSPRFIMRVDGRPASEPDLHLRRFRIRDDRDDSDDSANASPDEVDDDEGDADDFYLYSADTSRPEEPEPYAVLHNIEDDESESDSIPHDDNVGDRDGTAYTDDYEYAFQYDYSYNDSYEYNYRYTYVDDPDASSRSSGSYASSSPSRRVASGNPSSEYVHGVTSELHTPQNQNVRSQNVGEVQGLPSNVSPRYRSHNFSPLSPRGRTSGRRSSPVLAMTSTVAIAVEGEESGDPSREEEALANVRLLRRSSFRSPYRSPTSGWNQGERSPSGSRELVMFLNGPVDDDVDGDAGSSQGTRLSLERLSGLAIGDLGGEDDDIGDCDADGMYEEEDDAYRDTEPLGHNYYDDEDDDDRVDADGGDDGDGQEDDGNADDDEDSNDDDNDTSDSDDDSSDHSDSSESVDTRSLDVRGRMGNQVYSDSPSALLDELKCRLAARGLWTRTDALEYEIVPFYAAHVASTGLATCPGSHPGCTSSSVFRSSSPRISPSIEGGRNSPLQHRSGSPMQFVEMTRTDTTIDSPSTLGALPSTTCKAGYHSCEGKDVVVQDGFKELIASLPSLDAVARAIRGTHCREQSRIILFIMEFYQHHYLFHADDHYSVYRTTVVPLMVEFLESLRQEYLPDVQWGYMFRRTRSLNGDEIMGLCRPSHRREDYLRFYETRLRSLRNLTEGTRPELVLA